MATTDLRSLHSTGSGEVGHQSQWWRSPGCCEQCPRPVHFPHRADCRHLLSTRSSYCKRDLYGSSGERGHTRATGWSSEPRDRRQPDGSITTGPVSKPESCTQLAVGAHRQDSMRSRALWPRRSSSRVSSTSRRGNHGWSGGIRPGHCDSSTWGRPGRRVPAGIRRSARVIEAPLGRGHGRSMQPVALGQDRYLTG